MNISHIIYISYHPLAPRTRVDVVELIVRKNLLLWWSFWVLEVIFYSLICLQDKNKFKCPNETAIGKSLDQRTATINRSMRLQLFICHKKELLSSLSSVKLELMHQGCRSRDQFFVVSVSVLVSAVLYRSWSWSRTVVVLVSYLKNWSQDRVIFVSKKK